MGRWQDMALEELEEQYSPSRWSRRMDSESVIQAHVDVMTAGTQRAQAAARTLLDVPYGDGDGEKLDVYFPADSSETFPVFVYIHGGYWQDLSKDTSGFAAPVLLSQGIAVVALGYDIAPKGHMDAMVLQVRRSLAFLVKQYHKIRGIYLCGHSAGAHLAAMVLSTDWTEFGVVPDIRGAVLVSGVYDLEPLLHTYVNDALNMSLVSSPGKWPRGTVPSCLSNKQCLWLCPVRFLWLWPSMTPRSSVGSHRNTARLCARLVGLSLCWILPAWITLTSLRSCQRKPMSSHR
ncbi:kynurenine formamidase isoform X2 [Cyrtonyx montezumae]|uniref:kynurenine formamidase isoform X2 n=1 Tax=Cyrtonyx montezumae TaxID=9017 RepID=UPI0032DAE8AC